MVQFYAAMAKCGLTTGDLMEMHAASHANLLAAFMNSVISASELDQSQAGYKYDYVIHSVMPVPENIALAKLKPVPGVIQYAPGCQDCFYKLHELYSPKENKTIKQWYRRVGFGSTLLLVDLRQAADNVFAHRYNLAVSEDITQLTPGYTLFSKPLRVDCEDFAQHAIRVAKALNKLKADFATQSNITLDEVMHPKLFAFMDTAERINHIKAIDHILSQFSSIECVCNTCNAHGGQVCTVSINTPIAFNLLTLAYCLIMFLEQASATNGTDNSDLTGHAFAGARYTLRVPAGTTISDPFVTPNQLHESQEPGTIVIHDIIEGTKWVNPMHDKVTTRVTRNACLELPSLQAVNQIGSLLMECTKLSTVIPTTDKGSAELTILQNRGPGFYANVYVSGDHMVFHESIPGIKTSPLAMGAPLAYTIHNVASLRPMQMHCNLATQHLRTAGCTNLGDGDIWNMIMDMAMEEAIPTWRMQEYNANVFNPSLPCHEIYRNKTVTQGFVPGKHCCFSYTHHAATGMTMDLAKQYANNTIEIIHQNKPPPVTFVHASRLKTAGLPPGMPGPFVDQIKSFNPDEINAHLKGLFVQDGRQVVHVESISTVMGCVLVTCVAEVEHLPKVVNGMIAWAKPIIQAGQIKQAACIAWRKQLESQFCIAQQQQMPSMVLQQGKSIAQEAAVAEQGDGNESSDVDEDMENTSTDASITTLGGTNDLVVTAAAAVSVAVEEDVLLSSDMPGKISIS